jgi:phosphatidylserine decarboxylase
MSVKQGIKYDAPESAKDIPAFIDFHNLDMSEILDPLDSFKNFNEFFYRCACPRFTIPHAYLLLSPRKLKPDARPVENPDDPNRLVSGADCRLMAFESVNEATRIWIKGREFSVAHLLGQAYAEHVDKYNGGALCIFRLAPQDYHRFHSPVDGKIGKMTYISGEYYTVNVSVTQLVTCALNRTEGPACLR